MITPKESAKSSALVAPSPGIPQTGQRRTGSPSSGLGTRNTEHGASSASSGHSALTDDLFNGLLKFFSSLRLTVVCLGLGIVLVFAGTLAQVDLGLYKAQNQFFRSFFIY